MLANYEVQIHGVGKKPIRDVFVCTSPHFAKILAQDKYGDWIRFGEVKELMSKAQKKAKAAETANSIDAPRRAQLSRVESRRGRSKRWQTAEQHRRYASTPALPEGPPTYLWG